jgi:hypothetical protein
VPNFCPECGSSQATSRFCSSCGYSLASTPASPDASTRVEDTPVFHPFAPPVVETWDSLAADPWSSNAGAVTPPPVRNVVTQTPVDLRSYQRERLIKKLVMLRRLWGGVVAGVFLGVVIEIFAYINASFISTNTRSDVLGVLGIVIFVALLTMTGVMASAGRQVGAKIPHPVVTILFVIGAAVSGTLLSILIFPDLLSDTEAVLLLNDMGDDGYFRYVLAILISSFFLYAAALAPVVALSKALKDRYPGDPLYQKMESRGQDAAPTLYESVRVGWWRVLLSALFLGAFDVLAAMTDVAGPSDRPLGGMNIGLVGSFAMAIGFLLNTADFNKPIEQAVSETQAKRDAEWKDRQVVAKADWLAFWRWCLYIVGSIGGMFLLLFSIAFIVGIFRQ